jgi:hypothetical protein
VDQDREVDGLVKAAKVARDRCRRSRCLPGFHAARTRGYVRSISQQLELKQQQRLSVAIMSVGLIVCCTAGHT